jgi:hypothetical protein
MERLVLRPLEASGMKNLRFQRIRCFSTFGRSAEGVKIFV